MADTAETASNPRLEQVQRVLERLDRSPGLRPVADGEGLTFCAHDLASLAEVAFGHTIDPPTLAPADVSDLARRLDYPLQEDDEFRRRYWITHRGQTIGTLAVDDHSVGRRDLHLSSLYLQPYWRGKGLGRTTVNEVFEAAVAEQMSGLRVEADWLQPGSVSFYLRLGFEVAHWKHAIHLVRRPHSAPLLYRRQEDERLLLTDSASGERLLLTATRTGDWLNLRGQPGEALVGQPRVVATMAVHLALEGFPLIRDAERWEQASRWSEGGEPEGLARRIWFFEEYARRCGHLVTTPAQVLPADLHWPTWD